MQCRDISRLLARTMLTAFLAIGGCFTSSAPIDDSGFAPFDSSLSRGGIYRNAGESNPGSPPVALAALLFSDPAAFDPGPVDAVAIEFVAPDRLVLRARVGVATVAERELVSPAEFGIEADHLLLWSRGAWLSSAPDDPLVGPRRERLAIGIDANGDLRVERSFLGAGCVFCLLPTVASFAEITRYRRIDAETVESPVGRFGQVRTGGS